MQPEKSSTVLEIDMNANYILLASATSYARDNVSLFKP